MKETALTLTIILVFVILFSAESASANFKPYQPPKITILSPSSNETYNSSSVSLNVKVVLSGVYPWANDDIASLNYSLDGQPDVPISYSSSGGGVYLHGNDTLSILYNGLHNISVHGESIKHDVRDQTEESIHFKATASFTVDAPETAFKSLTPAPEPNQQEPFPTLLIVALLASVIVVSVGLVICFRKRRGDTKPS